MSGRPEFFADFINEWTQLRSGFNWRTFRIVTVEVEDDRMMGAVEATFVILGFGVRFRLNYMDTDFTKELEERSKELKGE